MKRSVYYDENYIKIRYVVSKFKRTDGGKRQFIPIM